MPQPAAYARSYSFTDHETSFPSEQQPGASLDGEFDAIADTTDQIRANLALIQRDDGELANNSVGFDQLSEGLTLGIHRPAAWAASTAYEPLDAVWLPDGKLYRCLTSHTSSSVFSSDAANWDLVFDLAALAEIAIQTAAIGEIDVDGTTLEARFAGIDTSITSLGAADTAEAAARAAADTAEAAARAAADTTVADTAAADTLTTKNLAIALAAVF